MPAYLLRSWGSATIFKIGVVSTCFTLFFLFPLSLYAEPSGGLRGRLFIDGSPAEDVIVYLRDFNRPPASVVPMSITIRQEKFKFKPKLNLVTVGSTVTFQNNDFEVHNAKSDSPENQFDLGMLAPGISKKTILKNPGAVDLRCRVHSDMEGIVFVAPSPFFVLIEYEGRFDLSGVPPGEYELNVWHPQRRGPEVKPAGVPIRVGSGITTIDLDWKGNILTRKNP